MGNPYPVDISDLYGSVRLGGNATFTDPNNQPGGGGGSSLYPVIAGKQLYVASTGNQSSDTTAINNALSALPASGGTIALDQGPYTWQGGAVNLTKPVHLLGTGPSGVQPAHDSFLAIGTTINCTSQTLDAIDVSVSGCTFEKLFVNNTAGSAPSAGAGIKVVANAAFYGRNMRIIDCCLNGFYYNIDFEDGFYWIIDRCVSKNPVKNGIRVGVTNAADTGDQSITNTTIAPGAITTTGATAIACVGVGGGLRVSNCKVNNSVEQLNAFQVGIGCTLDAPLSGAYLFSGNSIENTAYGILMAGTGVIDRIVITGNEFESSTNSIAINPTGATAWDDIEIGPNVGLGATSFSNVTNLRIHGLPFSTAGRPTASMMAPGAWYWDTTLHIPGYADGAGNWRKADATIF